jgi:hypothetical protein
LNLRADLQGRIARTLTAHAARIAKPDYAEWTTAMIHEQEHLPPDASALSWALGCVLVSYRGRLCAMTRLPDLPRWLLLTGLLICLGPACAYFIFVAVSAAQGYLLFALPYTVAQEGLIFGSATSIGPIGLAAAFWTLSSPAHRAGTRFLAILWVLTIWALAVYAGLLAHYGLLARLSAASGELLTLLVPFVLLPAFAVAQLHWLDARRRGTAELAGG